MKNTPPKYKPGTRLIGHENRLYWVRGFDPERREYHLHIDQNHDFTIQSSQETVEQYMKEI